MCRERADTCSLSDTVKACILHVHGLHVADAIYHQTCSVNFHTKKQMTIAQLSTTEDIKRPRLGRPRDAERTIAFLETARYFEENDDEQITINHPIDLMEQKLAGTKHEAYGCNHR